MADESKLDWKDAEAKLDPSDAYFLEGSEANSVPLNETKEVRIAWEFGRDDNYSLFENYLRLRTWPTNSKEQRWVEDPEVDGVPLPGIWRQAFITRIERQKQGHTMFLIVLTLRRGWAESIDWTEALLIERKNSDGNSESVSGVDDSSSYDDASAVIVRFPNISPYKMTAVMAELAASVYTDQQVQDNTLTGSWHKAFTASKKKEDGSAYVDLVLSRERFTLSLYQNYGTARQADIWRIYNVTKDIAQNIADDWQDEGRSVDIVYNESTSLCTITLTDKDVQKQNMSTEWMKNGCDQYLRLHFAWGYTKDELEDWIKVHDGLLNVPAVDGDERADTQPITRKVSVVERGDGLFNATIEERKFNNADPNIPDFTITLPSGTKITRQVDHAWNMKSSEMDAIKATYDTSVAAVGLSVDFRTTREDDCSFDFVAVITTVTAAESTLESTKGAQGINQKVFTGRDLTQAIEKTTLEALLVGGARKRASLDLNISDDESLAYKAQITEVQKAIDTIDSGSSGEKITAFTGRNVDAADLSGISGLASAIRKHVSLQLSGNDDNTFNYSAVISEPQEVQESAYSYDNAGDGADLAADDGVGIKAHSGKNVDSGDLQTLITDLSAPRVRLSISMSPNDDGSLDYTVQEQHVQEVENTISSGANGVAVVAYAGKNMDIGDISSLSSAIRERVSLSLSPNDDGTFDWVGTKQTVQKVEDDMTSGVAGIEVTTYAGRNVDADDLAGVVTSAARVSATFQLSGNDDGTFNYVATKRTVREVEDDMTSGSAGVGVTAYTGRNVDADDLAGVVTSAARERVALQLSANDDGTFNYSATKQTVREVADDMTSGAGGVGVTTYAGRNVDAADLATVVTSSIRNRVSIQLSGNDDGTFNYVATEQTVQETNSSHTTTGTDGIVAKLYFGSNADLGDLPAITSGFRKRHSISINAEDDGSVRYGIVETTVDTVEDAWSFTPAGAFGIDKTLYSGNNATPAELDAVIVGLAPTELIDYDVIVSGNDDGTVNYRIHKTTKISSSGDYNVGSVGENVDLTVATNKNTLADPGHPSARGVTVELSPSFDDAGGISYRKLTRTKQEVTAGFPSGAEEIIKYGTSFYTTQEWHQKGDTTLDDLDVSATIAEGTNVSLQVQLDDDGSVSLLKRTQTSNEVNTAELDMANLAPSLNRFGYVDTVALFENIKSTDDANDLDTYFKFTGTVYGYVDNIRFNDDGTVSGRSVTRTYNSVSWLSIDTLDIPNDVTAQTPSGNSKTEMYVYSVIYDQSSLYAGYWVIRYKLEEYYDVDHDKIADFKDGSIHNMSTEGKLVVSGREVWWARVCTEIKVSNGQTGDLTLSSGFTGEGVVAFTITA
jgi:hypothetical protein